jgi:hypothetical protein
MKKLILCLCFSMIGSAILWAQTVEQDFPKSFSVKVTNPLNVSRENVLVVLTPEQIKKKAKGFNAKAFVVLIGGKEVPSQYNSANTPASGIAFVLDQVAASASLEVSIRYHPTETRARNYPKKTQAELSHKTGGEWKNREYIGGSFKNVEYLRVPPEHKDHSWFVRYEGPGWESDKVGYRFYLDQRNATDVFGKKVSEPVLQLAGQDGFDSYHEMQPWGMDVMKVGSSLGVGSLGALVNGAAIRVEKTDSVTCRITENGSVYSSILTKYFGWRIGNKKHDVQSHISIHAGTRLTHQVVTITNQADSLCTGIVKDKAAKLFTSMGNAEQWGYLATYGKQSLNADELGLVVFFNPAHALELTEDKFSHIVTMRPAQGKLEYYFAGAWVLEQNGIKSEGDFLAYVSKIARELAHPITVGSK